MTKQAKATQAAQAAPSAQDDKGAPSPIAQALASAKPKRLTKAEQAHAAQIDKGADMVAGAAWSAGAGQVNLTAALRAALLLPEPDAVAVLTGAYERIAERAQPEPLEAGADKKARAAYEEQRNLLAAQWWKASNTIATMARQALEKLPAATAPAAISVKLDKATMKAVVTLIPNGATKEQAAALLDHDKKAAAQVAKRLDKRDAALADAAAKAAGLPAPSEEAAKAAQAKALEDAAKDGLQTTAGRPLADFPPELIAYSLRSWPSADLGALAALLSKQAQINARVETKAAKDAADAQAKAKPAPVTAAGKPRKAAGKGAADGATLVGERLARPAAQADAQARDAAGVEPGAVLSDPAVTGRPVLSDDQKARKIRPNGRAAGLSGAQA